MIARIQKPCQKSCKPSPSSLLSGPSSLSRLLSTSLADLVIKHHHPFNQILHNSPPLLSNSSPSASTVPTISSSTTSEPSCSTSSSRNGAPASWRIRVPVWAVLVQFLVLVMMAVDRRKLVVGITVLTFGFWFLEVIGFQVSWFMKSDLGCGVGGESELDSDEGGDGSVSYSDITGSERSSFDSESGDWDIRKNVVGCLDDSSVSRRKKKLFKKFVSKKKIQSKRDCNEETVISSGNASRRVRDDITEVATEDEVEGEENVLKFLAPAVVVNRKRVRAEIVQGSVHREKSRNCQKFEFVIVILFGLLGGKSVALVLTLSWFLFRKFTDFFSTRRVRSSV